MPGILADEGLGRSPRSGIGPACRPFGDPRGRADHRHAVRQALQGGRDRAGQGLEVVDLGRRSPPGRPARSPIAAGRASGTARRPSGRRSSTRRESGRPRCRRIRRSSSRSGRSDTGPGPARVSAWIANFASVWPGETVTADSPARPGGSPSAWKSTGLVEPVMPGELHRQAQLAAPRAQGDLGGDQLEMERRGPCDPEGEAVEDRMVEGVPARLVDERETLARAAFQLDTGSSSAGRGSRSGPTPPPLPGRRRTAPGPPSTPPGPSGRSSRPPAGRPSATRSRSPL